ncbi:ABC transporter substrate-binding protein [Pokkaliibacter sp. MBI-7]|uniref:ABC transporter substrate-binding protein n=1 Tax=Pokkaliibacter sp. MBI-7 TaxID=3040600 RepID=UPI00244D7A04|nr:ABC transporter substrate-binding protein [Pokkaliibacter sp. MBI-7]MDH2433232.1 ABC transporter substrate-binding protein [Pokkaliibacter sp. MBI-7]
MRHTSSPLARLARFSSAGLLALAAGYATQAAAACEVDKTIHITGMSWSSNLFMAELARDILEKGYDCKAERIPGETIAMLTALIRGDADLMPEMWMNTMQDLWEKGKQQDKVEAFGDTYDQGGVDAEAWYVPRYVVEGDEKRGIKAMAPDLKSVSDLPKYKALFKDPEEPEKGRFYNCPTGWNCEVVNSNKLVGYGLDSSFSNFRPGTGAALKAAIATNYKRGKPIVFYYWGPTDVLGKYDLVRLQEPAYDKAVFDQLIKPDSKPDKATAYPKSIILKAANKEFAQQAPQIMAFWQKFNLSNDEINKVLATMDNNNVEAEDAATQFLKEHPEQWSQWVPAGVAAKIKASL